MSRRTPMSSEKKTAWDIEADKLFGSWNGELLSAYSDEARKCCEQLARALAAAYERGREDENRACEDIVRPEPGPEPRDFNVHRALQRQRRRLSAAIAARRTACEENDGVE